MFYEFATLDLRDWQSGKAQTAIAAHADGGTLLGCWDVEIGALGRLYLLRSFESEAALRSAHADLSSGGNPYAAGESLIAADIQLYAGFPFMPPVAPGAYGAVYEFREYHLKPDGLAPSIDAWEKALPGRTPISPVLIAMGALDGPNKMLHIVGFPGLDARTDQRRELYQKGLWPPDGAWQQIVNGTSSIAIPSPISRLR